MLNPFAKWGLIGLGGVCVILLGAVLWLRADLASAEADLQERTSERDAAWREIERQKTYIADVTKLRADTDAILLKLANDIAGINKQAAETVSAIRDLENSDAEVRDLLSRALPDGLKRLLNRP